MKLLACMDCRRRASQEEFDTFKRTVDAIPSTLRALSDEEAVAWRCPSCAEFARSPHNKLRAV